MRERRHMLVRIDREELLTVFGNWVRHHTLVLPELTGAPDDWPPQCEVDEVHNDWETKSFVLVVYHPRFPIVPPGEVPPYLHGGMGLYVRAVKVEELSVTDQATGNRTTVEAVRRGREWL